MIFFLFLFCSSKWWNFTDADFYVYMQEDSKLVPIVGLFTNSSQSNTIMENFKNFSTNFQSTYKIDFTHVDCLKTNFCNTKVQISEFPSIYLIQGPLYFYWKKIEITNWESEINNFMNSNEPELLANNEYSLEKVQKGGSLFQLTIQKQFKTVYNFFCKYITYYRIFNSSFTYSINESIQAATITCYFSENCFIRQRIRPIEIESFFEENKFSFYHVYHQNEIKNYIEISPFAFIVFQDQSQMNFSSEKVFDTFKQQCSKFKFGFIDSKKNQNFIKEFSLENKTLPFVFAINVFENCYSTFSIDANRTFYDNVYNGENCEKIGRKFNLIPKSPKKSFTMLSFALTFGFVFAFIYCISTSRREEPFSKNNYSQENELKEADDDNDFEFQTLKHEKID